MTTSGTDTSIDNFANADWDDPATWMAYGFEQGKADALSGDKFSAIRSEDGDAYYEGYAKGYSA